MPAVREVLQYFLVLGAWDRAQNHVFGASLGLRPDLRPGKSRIRQAKKQQKWQELYFLEAILQGSMDLHAEASLVTDDQGVIRCKWCGAAVHESAWVHLSWKCEHFLRSPAAEIQSTAYLVPETVEAMTLSPTLWLRGIPSLPLEEAPLSMLYWAFQAGPNLTFQRMNMQEEPINVEGCLMGGHGSGGERTKDPRLRRCGFGLVVLEPQQELPGDCMQKEPSGDRRHKELSGDRSRLIRKIYFGSVPGAQNSYRAEANALLHALTYTNGNTSLVLDCKGVIRQYNKGPRTNLKHDGLLWAAIFRAKQSRIARGGGVITLIWTPSHKTHQVLLSRGIPLSHWVVNTLADSLAGKGARESAMEQDQIDLVLGNEKRAHAILRRLVFVAVSVVPTSKHTACSSNKGPCRGSGKLEGLEKLARASGHSLTSLFKCVKCSLQLDLTLIRVF